MLRSKILLFILVCNVISYAQDSSKTVLNFEEFIGIVREHHPLAFAANLQSEKGAATLTKARGGFDPKLFGTVDQKYYDDKQYFSYVHAGLKIPTWFGISVDGGYDLNEGAYLNPSSRVPDNGLWYAGLNITLAKGLLIDDRRAELQQAKIYQESAQMEQRIMLNQLYYDASTAYWEWFKSYHKLSIYDNAVQNAQLRFEGIKSSAFLGDRPFIDTVEAGIVLQNRKIGYNESKLEYLNKTRLLEVFLWQEGLIPLELEENTIPPALNTLVPVVPDQNLLALKDSVLQNHPELVIYQNKLDAKAIDLRLKKQGILPSVDLKYNLLSEPIAASPFSGINPSDYKWGLQVNYPLFTRKERGSIKLASIELEQLRMEQQTKLQAIDYKIIVAYNTWLISIDQIGLFQRNVTDYTRLMDAEQRLFNIGESSLFLLNSRESALIESQLKLVESMRDNQISKNIFYYSIANLNF